jgi:hypothetical protein
MRTFLPIREDQKSLSAQPTLRTNRPAAAYARRSDHKAKDKEKDKSQSREMQTEDMIDWSQLKGWERRLLFEYFADLGLSGALRPDQRPDMLRLFDDIDSGKFDHGTVICWQENRLFRDETQIYYNQFIQKCLEHDILVVVVSPHLMIYDFRDEFLTEMFRWKCKESADFIKRHVKGWMIPAKFRAAWVDGEWAGLGDIPTGFIVDYDENSPTHKKLIPYWPHAEKKREIRELFVELGCNTSLLYQRLKQAPIIFPEFEDWVDPRIVKRFKMARHPGGGYFPKSPSTLIALLTDVNDIGYRAVEGVIRRNSKGEKVIDHLATCDRELFDLCYYSLANTDLDGNLILEGKRPKRYFHHGSKGDYGLLKFRIRSNQGEVRTHIMGSYEHGKPSTGGYFIVYDQAPFALAHCATETAIPCDELETLVVNRLMEHVREISSNQEDIAEYEKTAAKQRAERQRKSKQIDGSIKAIDKEQAGLTRSLGNVEAEIEEAEKAQDKEKKELRERLKQLIIDQINVLEFERRKLIQARADLEKEAKGALGSLDEELKDLETLWPKKTFEKRRSLLNFLIREVVIDSVSTHWMRVQVLWLHEEWGREEMHYRRRKGSTKEWTDEEDETLYAYYPTMPKSHLMELLPERGWESIIARAMSKGVSRELQGRPTGQTVGGNKHDSYTDRLFMQEHTIGGSTKYTNWVRLCLHSQSISGRSPGWSDPV